MASPLHRALPALALALALVAAPTVSAGQADPDSLPRVVSLVPAASAFLVALGAEAAVVGRSSDDRTEGLEQRPEVGRVLEPDLESLVALRPDVVVVWADADHADLERVAERVGARVVPIRLDRLSDLEAALPTLGALVSRGEEAERLLAGLRRGLDALARGGAAGGTAPSVLWVVWTDPAVVAGPATLPAGLLAAVGARNALPDAPTSWPRPSFEWLVARDPDVVVWPVGHGVPPLEGLPADSPWHALPAVRAGRVAELDAELVHEVGPRILEAARALARALDSLTSERTP